MVKARIIDSSENNNRNDTEFWLLRHGKSPHNKPDEIATFAGGRVDNPLSNEGRSETSVLAEKIAENNEIDLIITSHMKRSKETGGIIATFFKELKGKKIPVVEIDNLQEVDVGDFTNLTEKQARDKDPQAANAFYSGEIECWDFPRGENYQDLVGRVKSVINQIRTIAIGKKRVLVIGHGMFNRAFNHQLFNDRTDLWKPRSYPHDQIVIFTLGEK